MWMQTARFRSTSLQWITIQVDVFELYHLDSSYVLPHFSVVTAHICISFLHPRPSTAPEALIQLRTKGTEVTLHNVGGRERNKKREVPWSSISVWPAILSVLFDDIFIGVQSDDSNGIDWICISMSIYIYIRTYICCACFIFILAFIHRWILFFAQNCFHSDQHCLREHLSFTAFFPQISVQVSLTPMVFWTLCHWKSCKTFGFCWLQGRTCSFRWKVDVHEVPAVMKQLQNVLLTPWQ